MYQMKTIDFLDKIKFDSPELDYIGHAERKKIITFLFKRQLDYMKNNVPYYAIKYKNTNLRDIETYEDCASLVPTTRKSDMRALPTPYDLLPTDIRKNPEQIYLFRGTGGTTGRPTSMFYTHGDWRAMVDGMTRPLKCEVQNFSSPIISFDSYNQGHISGPIFDDTIKKLGGLPIARNFGSDDYQAIKQMEYHNCNLLIAPAVSTHKGGSLESLLESDTKNGTNYINGENITTIFHSSTQMPTDLRDELKGLGIKYFYDYYGSTDVLPTAISCQAKPEELHLNLGHISLFILGEDGEHVKSGQRGLVVTGRIGAYDMSGRNTVAQATQLLNYHVGDEVTYVEGTCLCGRTTPRIKNIKRVLDLKDKQASGCEVW